MESFLLLGLPLLMAGIVFLSQNERIGKTILLLTSFFHLLTTISFWQRPRDIQFNSFLGFDALSQLILNLISILFFAVSIYLIGYLKEKNGRSNGILIGCLLCLLAAMTLVTMSRHMGLLWIAIGATTLLSAPAINHDRTPQSIEATWKYLLISSLGIALGLLGTLFLAISATPVTNIFLADILSNANSLSPSWLKLSIIFLLVGYGTKMGLAPMHTWKPDAYGEAPSPVGALMSGAITGCAFLAIFRVAQISFYAHLQEFISPILILLGILSLGVAAVFILGQKNFNRMLGYSSVEHMGILILGMGLGGGAIWASLFHAINNAFAKGLMFLVAGNLDQTFRSKKVGNIQGVIHRLPVTGIFLILGFIVITGFPPFGIFYSELLILKEAMITQRYITVFFYFLFLSVIFFGYSNIILGMALGRAGDKIDIEIKKENFTMIMPLVILAVVLFFSGIFVPQSFYDLIDEGSRLLVP
jgi:hydrogenase-4 component F